MTGRVAVVGAGISGLTAAYLLRRRYDVALYEAAPRLGGHAHTHDVTDAAGRALRVDSGFIVHNRRTYPQLLRLFTELGVPTQASEMSMSIRVGRTGLEYAGGRGLRGIFAQRRRVASPAFLRLLGQIRRFHRDARHFLRTSDDADRTTLGEFLDRHGFGPAFVRDFAVPLVSCVWSTGTRTALDYPARYLFRFLDHHGLLQVGNSPRWRTVVGGSRTYVDAVRAVLADVRLDCAVAGVRRGVDGVTVTDARGGAARYDKVVLATHADEALDLLDDATAAEKEVLGAFRYAANTATLHSDDRLLPAARGARACWNYLVPETDDGDPAPVVSYWMNRLHRLRTATPYLVTLNAPERIDPAKVIAQMRYTHPVYDLAAVAAQRRLPELTTDRTAFAGAYHGWGFHEDGCRSGAAAAEAFGAGW
ncbi:amine oxidase [Pilimelia terevasa]|uniref:Amine oxidase n=1 Tax=Pilimelia terevasa TaxID=53372 RepID=A0A8J3BU93_9ACTN|nr:FAD-dependent oxidoreductase [Pilimelia terevasa]GGK42703.1 amine oxidase [Pilimelia terevasa]